MSLAQDRTRGMHVRSDDAMPSIRATVTFAHANVFLQLAGHSAVTTPTPTASLRVCEIRTEQRDAVTGPYLHFEQFGDDDDVKVKCVRHEGFRAITSAGTSEATVTIVFDSTATTMMAWLCGESQVPLTVQCQTATLQQPEHVGNASTKGACVHLRLEALPDMSGCYVDMMHGGKHGCVRQVQRINSTEYNIAETPYERDEVPEWDPNARWTATLHLQVNSHAVAVHFNKITHTKENDKDMQVQYHFGPNMKAFTWNNASGFEPNIWLSKDIFYPRHCISGCSVGAVVPVDSSGH